MSAIASKMLKVARHNETEQPGIIAVFEPEALMPSQFFGTWESRVRFSGEHRLLNAILRDAVECFQKHVHADDPRNYPLYRDAEEWIVAKDDSSLVSFDNVCAILGLNAEYVRSGLLAWRDKELKRRNRGLPTSRRHIRQNLRITV